ncbi:MAG: Gldg family protein [Candidatus Glassbacteria bacterium]
MKRNKATEKISNAVYVAIILAIVLVVNVLGTHFFKRLDLTSDKLYTVSPVTRQLLRELDDVVSVKAYISGKLPVQIKRLPKEIDDLLAEYEIYSGGNIHYERLDPGDNEDLKQQLAGLGVMPVTMTIIERDERQQINGYLAITVSYGEHTESVPVVQNTEDLEYELTSRVYRVTHDPARVGFLSSWTRHNLMNDYGMFAQEVRKIHDLEEVNFENSKKVPDHIQALIVAGPTDTVPESVKFAIDQYIMRGGKVLFLVDNLVLGPDRQPVLVNHGLSGMLMTYGLRLNNNVVRDLKSHSPERVAQGIFSFNQPNPFFPRVGPDQFGQHPLVGRLNEMTLPWTSSLEAVSARDSLVAYHVLAQTTDQGETFGPPTWQPSPLKQKLPLAILATGSFQSSYQARPDLATAQDTLLKASLVPTELILVGSSSFVQNQFLYPGNLEFVLNAIDFLTIGDRLISIRTRPTTDRPLKDLSPEMKNFMRIVNIVGLPVFVILFGAMRFYLKRRDKAMRSRMV